MKKIKVTIIIPVYNEKDSISRTILDITDALKNYNSGYEIICVNDASKDESEKILAQLAEKNIIKVINHPVNKGYGASIKTGISAAEGEWIMITDADGTYPINKMPLLLSQKDKYNMVVGARIGKKVKIPLLRRPIKSLLNKFSSYLAGQEIPDLNSGLRIFDKKIALDYWNLFPERFSFTSTMTMICTTKGYSTLFTPINYMERKGKSSIHPIKDTIRFFTLLFRLSLYFNPLKTFIPISIICFLFSVLRGVRDIIVTADQHIGNFAFGLFFLSIQIFFFGLIAEIINKK